MFYAVIDNHQNQRELERFVDADEAAQAARTLNDAYVMSVTKRTSYAGFLLASSSPTRFAVDEVDG